MHLLRCRLNYDAASNNPCEDFDFGETEDYMVIIDLTTNSNNNLPKYNIYYQENNNSLNFNFNEWNFENKNLKIYDSSGKIIFQNNLADSKQHIQLPNVSKGVYLAEFEILNQKIVYKFIK
jgi:hypothetical protein